MTREHSVSIGGYCGIDRRVMRSVRSIGTSVLPYFKWVMLLAIPLSVALFAFRDTFSDIVSIWLQSKTYIHGFLIVPVCAALVWTNRKSLADAPKRPYWAGFVLLVALSGFWVICNRLGVQAGEQFAAVSMISVLVLTILGTTAASRIAFPLVYLLFAVPFGDFLIPWLVEFTARFTVFALNFTGIPVFADAQFFRTSAGDFEVARACSGVRFLLSSLAVGSLYAYLNFESYRLRAAFIVFSALFPIVANGLRVYLIVMVAHLSNLRLAVGVDHFVYGWVFFGFIITIMLMVGNWLRHHLDDRWSTANLRPDSESLSAENPLWKAVMAASLATLIISMGPALGGTSVERTSGPGQGRVGVPAEVTGWKGPTALESEWRPIFESPASEQVVSFSTGQFVVELYVVQYASVSQSAELANSQNMVMDDDSWLVKLPRIVDTGIRSGPKKVREILGSRHGDERLVWYWYDVNGSRLLDLSSVKLEEAKNWLSGENTLSTLVAVSTPVARDYRTSAEILRQFLAASRQSIDNCILRPADGTTECATLVPGGLVN